MSEVCQKCTSVTTNIAPSPMSQLMQMADLVREERFRNMESLDSLMALSRPEEEDDAAAAAGNGTRRPSNRSQAWIV